MQLESRQELIESVQNPTQVIAAFAVLDAVARVTLVRFHGKIMALHSVLQEQNDVRTKPLQLIVHPEMPLRQDGKIKLLQRAQKIEYAGNEQCTVAEMVELWRDIFLSDIDQIITKHPEQSVIIHDPHSNVERSLRNPLSIQSIDTRDPNRQSGFLTPQDFTTLFEYGGSITPQVEVRIHGSSFGACPTGTTLQLAAASLYGTHLPDENSRPTAVLVHAMGETAALSRRTRIRMGTLMDYAGMHAWLKEHAEFAGIFRICDENTKVIPDEMPHLMRGLDLRK